MDRKRNYNKKYQKYNKKGSKNIDHNYLVNVYHDTMNYFSSLGKLDKESIKYDITTLNTDILDGREVVNENPVIEYFNSDTLDLAHKLVTDGYHPLVLNMASKFKPGGGVRTGKTAQEEVIFRRSNAFMTHPMEWYPLTQYEVIYSPQVYVVKDSNYDYLDKYFEVSMLAIPAVKNPKLVGGKYNEDDEYIMRMKIKSIFIIALEHNTDSLVLGALGSGAYCNPPDEVAKIFKEYLQIYGKYFKKIVFGILSVKDNNYDIFKTIIG